jgi:Glycosyltransferase family 87
VARPGWLHRPRSPVSSLAEMQQRQASISRPSAARFDGRFLGGTLRGLWLGVTWVVVLGFLAWAVRLAAIEGYVYPLGNQFVGDFKSAITGEGLGPNDWWAGRGLFYGPLFVLEWRLVLYPGYLSIVDVAHLDLALFAISFGCTLAALFDRIRPRLFVLLLAAWLAHHVTIELFAAVQHLEVLELAGLALALLLLQRNRPGAAGVSLGLAAAAKTLPVVFLAYLVILRRWRALAVAAAVAAALLVIVCFVQGVTPWDGLLMLLNQRENLGKTKATEYELGLRAFLIRFLTNDQGNPTPQQTQLAFGLHALISLVVVLFAAVVLWWTTQSSRSLALAWGLIATTMLVVAPVTHIFYYVFMLPAWTAVLAELVDRRLSWVTAAQWLALIASYVLMGFDQPILLIHRLFGVGQVVLDHWLSFIPLALLLTVGVLASCLGLYHTGRQGGNSGLLGTTVAKHRATMVAD